MGVSSQSLVTPSRSFQSFSRSISTPASDQVARSPSTPKIPMSSDTSRSSDNSQSSSSSSCGSSPSVSSHYHQRPSTLHGLKHKLHSAAKNIHSPNRRKSVGHIPLSPLARTPSPSPLPSSPTRSPSPLTFPPGHQPGSSNTTQSYSPGSSSGSSSKKTFARPKSSEPGSPLLRRALSPDRLHPRSAENKVKQAPTSISPLCDPALKVTISSAPRVTITSKSSSVQKPNPDNETSKHRNIEPHQNLEKEKHLTDANIIKCDDSDAEFTHTSSQPLPRIAEEKDSPTATKEESLLSQTGNSNFTHDFSVASPQNQKNRSKSSFKGIGINRRLRRDNTKDLSGNTKMN